MTVHPYAPPLRLWVSVAVHTVLLGLLLASHGHAASRIHIDDDWIFFKVLAVGSWPPCCEPRAGPGEAQPGPSEAQAASGRRWCGSARGYRSWFRSKGSSLGLGDRQ